MPRLPCTSTDGPEPTWPLTCGFRSPATPNEPQFFAVDIYYPHFICGRPALGIASGPPARTMTGGKMGRREEVLRLLSDVRVALDDDDIGDRLGINRHYVNRLCRDLAGEGLVWRRRGTDNKFVNSVIDGVRTPNETHATPAPERRQSTRSQDRIEGNVNELIENFGSC